ncbi:MAG: hypothetical protein JO313_15190 [Verrucomicrobia bacterium]|nr:hypothetical protein [Verrucomicrobiota bacterium]MBV9645068.1 hypothetical protein [Verrucomicrobiota bacterium]
MDETAKSETTLPESKLRPGQARLKTNSLPWQPLLLGAIAFGLITGGTILWPGNIRWLMMGDPSMNFIGWMFFRNGPIFQQPFGANWQYGMELSSSTVYCDSISVLAFPFKVLRAWLPEQFQYFGLWTFICYLLQGFFGWKLLGRLTQNRDGPWLRAVATAFFLVAPVFVWRIHWHLALGSHWLILAALYLYFSPGLRAPSWIVLLIVSSLVTPIILAMDLLIFGAALARQYFNRELTLPTAIKTVTVAFLLLLPVVWEAGYFMVGDVGSTGFGTYRTSILGFIDPGVQEFSGPGSWSYLFPDQPKTYGDYEGFSFFGTGMILLAAVVLARILPSGIRKIQWKELWPILLIFAFSILFALSNRIGFGSYVLIHYNLPFIAERLISPFRASGRFIWIAYYLLMAGILVSVVKKFDRSRALALLCFCLLLQITDSWKGLRKNYEAYTYPFQPPALESDFWQTAAKKYNKVCYTPPANSTLDFVQLCYFAASHHLPISLCRYGRTDEQNLVATRLQALQEIEQNGFDPRALYVFESAPVWVRELPFTRVGDWAGTVDGYRVVAPDWSPGTKQNVQPLIHDALPRYSFGTQLHFGPKDQGLQDLAFGWAAPEDWGVWSDGDESLLTLQLPDDPGSDAVLEIDGFGFINPKSRRQKIEVSVNSQNIGEFAYSASDRTGTRSVRIPRAILLGHGGIAEIALRYSDAASPARLGLFLDPRILAFGLRSLTLKPD